MESFKSPSSNCITECYKAILIVFILSAYSIFFSVVLTMYAKVDAKKLVILFLVRVRVFIYTLRKLAHAINRDFLA